jgi:phospholipid/cholesterol/gamma-HCH transport system permease protein
MSGVRRHLLHNPAAAAISQRGRHILQFISMSGELAVLCRRVLVQLITDPQRTSVHISQMYRIGYLSLPVVMLTGISMSLVLAVQGYATLRTFNAETITGGMVNFSLITQIMPVLTGLTLAGRVGSSIAAEIGTMKVTEQIDALRVLGTDPISYLVAPRFLACVLLMPLITAIGAMVGMWAAAWMAIGLWRIDPAAYWYHSEEWITWWEIVTGLGKTLAYGAIIALIACRKGLSTEGGATGVGESCTGAVVDSSMLILVTTFLLTVLLQQIWDVFFAI